MQPPSIVYLYRYSIFAITIVSSAIICSAAAWNLPISQNADLHTQLHIDAYMIFLGAFSLLVVLPMLFADILFQRAFTGRVWVECLWIDFLWLLHLVGAIIVTNYLPPDMCTPQAEAINGNSCTSVRLLMAFSWICTINLFIYLIFLVLSSILHQKRDDTIWTVQVRSYPWYLHLYCHRLGSNPKLPPPHHAPIPAPQPQRPINLLRQSVLSSLYRADRTSHRHSGTSERSAPAPQPAMGQMRRPVSMLRPTLYPFHVQAVLEPVLEPSSGGAISLSPYSGRSQQQPRNSLGGPSPLLNWPRADIMSHAPPKRTVPRKKAPSTELPREIGAGLPPPSLSSNLTRVSQDHPTSSARHV
ncbi:hypothetical protein BJV74DRAFT_859700 [Russula compacta]|nr:hypothetical protein BJV74DRAFT_859700 [Russula compacta]